MSKYSKESTMKHFGQVYKFTGIYGHIRPDTWGQTRQDVLFKKSDEQLKIGDKIVYEQFEKNGRRFAKNIQKHFT
jgi:hypothetical protein